MKNSTMYISKMNESAGARMSIVPIGITACWIFKRQAKRRCLIIYW
nr:hypothetical protein [Mycoplasmopsis bovis]